MESILLALGALQTLLHNPKLGGGGLRADQAVGLIGHLIELIQGGRKTAAALKAFADEIKAMADAGVQPTQRDFDGFTVRLQAALATVEEAKAKVAARSEKSKPPSGEEEPQS